MSDSGLPPASESPLPTPPQRIHWPEALDTQCFLRDYWQRKPLLIRAAFPSFATPLDADELAGLSLEPATTPRLITRTPDASYQLQHGPFEASLFATLGDSDWSLLVTDVEKHLPELRAWLKPFEFLPGWRRDDLMISYAPDGASVGAHTDEYDVFLLQASGQRRWDIDARPDVTHEQSASGDLRLVDNFRASDSWLLNPGDMLYLPPGVPHHGIAAGDNCTTWSIGFRAPSLSDVLLHFAQSLSEKLPHQRYRDGDVGASKPAGQTAAMPLPGELAEEAVERFTDLWNQAVSLSPGQARLLVGELLTQSGGGSMADGDTDAEVDFDNEADFEAGGNAEAGGDIESHTPPMTNAGHRFVAAPFSRFLWHSDHPTETAVTLFVDGEAMNCSRALAIALCAGESVSLTPSPAAATEDQTVIKTLAATEDQAIIRTLVDQGQLIAAH